jgi:hypothetical protein
LSCRFKIGLVDKVSKETLNVLLRLLLLFVFPLLAGDPNVNHQGLVTAKLEGVVELLDRFLCGLKLLIENIGGLMTVLGLLEEAQVDNVSSLAELLSNLFLSDFKSDIFNENVVFVLLLHVYGDGSKIGA